MIVPNDRFACHVCETKGYDVEGNGHKTGSVSNGTWCFSHIDDLFFCSSTCYNLYNINPLAYENGPKTGHRVMGWGGTSHNIDRDKEQ